MKFHTAAWSKWMAIAVAGLLSGCASDKLEHPSYWWNATVVSIERVADVPSGVNVSCISPPADGAATDDRPVMVVQYRVGKSPVTKAYADPKGADWFAGERVLVHPDTCRIKPAPVRAT